MAEDAHVLRLGEMILRQKGSFTRRLVHAIFSIALRLFFRRIETSGVELVPQSGALLFVLNHPNGLIDPALVFCALPRRVSFLAKSTLFRVPVISFLVRTVEALPLYRRLDSGEDLKQNNRTFEACHELLRRGRCIALFPEGVSHNSPQLLPVKTGAARIALGAISINPDASQPEDIQTLRIVPVGLYYTSKTSFRSEALLRFGPYMEVHPVELDEEGEPPRTDVKQLSSRIEAALREVTLNVESGEALAEVIKAEELFSSIYESIDIKWTLTQTFNTLRRLAEGRKLQSAQQPERISRLRERILKYEHELEEIGIAPENLSVSLHSRWYVFNHFLLRTLLLLLLLPLALTGAVIHLPAYLLCVLFSRTFTRHGADEIAPTVKILAAMMLMPLTWIVATLTVYFLWNWRLALLAFPTAIVCGYVAMIYLEILYDMRGWYKAVFLLIRRRGLFLRLLLERRLLHKEIEELGKQV
jgi:glycerol-3-phosphate O-acyltransferase/dihydroxyacetone phosphate acyltransferase